MWDVAKYQFVYKLWMPVCKRPEVKSYTDRFIKLIRHSFGFSQLNWSAQEKRGLTKQLTPTIWVTRVSSLKWHRFSTEEKACFLVWKSHNAPQPTLHDSSLRYAKKTRALLDCEEQVNREGSWRHARRKGQLLPSPPTFSDSSGTAHSPHQF